MIFRRKVLLICASIVVIAILTLIGLKISGDSLPLLSKAEANLSKEQDFPLIDTVSLTVQQKKIVTVLQEQHKAKHPGTYYSEGLDEPWCADFVSWVMREGELPLVNPHSGSWRIPGVATLQEYYQSQDKFHSFGSAYQPKLGDVVIYDHDGLFGQHTNIVIKNDKGILTTIGGNENGNVRVFTNTEPDKAMIVGFGTL